MQLLLLCNRTHTYRLGSKNQIQPPHIRTEHGSSARGKGTAYIQLQRTQVWSNCLPTCMHLHRQGTLVWRKDHKNFSRATSIWSTQNFCTFTCFWEGWKSAVWVWKWEFIHILSFWSASKENLHKPHAGFYTPVFSIRAWSLQRIHWKLWLSSLFLLFHNLSCQVLCSSVSYM